MIDYLYSVLYSFVEVKALDSKKIKSYWPTMAAVKYSQSGELEEKVRSLIKIKVKSEMNKKVEVKSDGK